MKRSSAAIIFFILCFNSFILSQTTNDFRTRSSGNWSETSVWEYYNGTMWVLASVVPSYNNANQISIRNGFTVSINSNITIDQIIVDVGGTLSLNSNVTLTINNGDADDFTINGIFNISTGVLGGSGTVVNNATINWSGGEIQLPGLTINPSGTLNISGDVVKSFRTGHIYLSGIINWSGAGNIQGGNGAVIDIQNGGSFVCSNDAGIYYDDLGGGYITINVNNGGNFKKLDGTGSTTIGTATLNNYGLVRVEKGRLILQTSGTHSGGFEILANSFLRFNGGTQTVQDGVLFSGSGNVELTNGILNSTGSTNGAVLTSTLTFDFSNGEISGVGILKVNGTMNWSSGTVSGSGSLTNSSSGTLNINSSSSKNISSGRSLYNYGIVNWNGGTISFWNTSNIYNHLGANFNIKSDASLAIGGESGSKTFTNYGTITKSTTSGVTTCDVTFNNDGGSVNVNSGRFTLTGGGAVNSTFTIASGAYLQFNGGTYSFTDGLSLSGAGIMEINSGIINSNGTSPIPSSGSSLTVNFSDGVLNGNFNLNGTMNWTGGTIGGSGTLTISSGATYNISGTSVKYITSNKVLFNNGVINWIGGNISFWNTSTINNQSGANFNIQSNADLSLGGESGSKIFENNGTITKTSSGTSSSNITFNNYGTFNLNNGTFTISGGGTNNGSISAATGTVLEFNSNYNLGSSSNISGNGTSTFSSGTVDINGTFSLLGTVNITGGTANFNQNSSIGTLNLSSGYLGGTGTVTISSGEWVGGTLTGNGTLKVPSSANLTISGTGIKYIFSGRTFLNEGTVNWTGGNINCLNSSVINNQTGANFNIKSDANIVNDGGTNTFQNNGSVVKSVATGTSIIYIEFNNNNSGTVTLNSGNLMFNGSGVHACNFTANSGTTIKFSGGTHSINLSASSSITGSGTIEFSGSTSTISGSGTYNPVYTIVSSGTATFNKDITFSNLTVSGGIFGGTGNAGISNTFQFSGGTITGTGTFTLLSTASANLIGSNKTFDGRTLELTNNSSTTWSGGNISLVNGGTINNSTGSVFNSQSSGIISGGTFTNNGTFNHSNSSATEISTAFTNNNLINIQSGKIYLSGLTNYSSTTKTLTGGTYQIAGALVLTEKFETNSALTTLSGGNAAILYRTFNPTYDNNGLRYLKANTVGSTLIFTNGFTYTTEVTYSSELANNGTFIIDAGGTFNMNRNSDYTNITFSGSGLLRIKGTFNWNHGIMKGGGITRIDSSGIMNIATSSYPKTIEIRTIENYGIINLTGSGLYTSNCGNNAIINNYPSGLFDIKYDTHFFEPSSYSDTLKFYNYGQLKKSSGSGTFYFRARIQLHISGILEVQSGNIVLDGGGSCSGSIIISQNSILNLRIGNYYISGGSSISGTGTFKMEPGDYNSSFLIIDDSLTGVSIGSNTTFSTHYNSTIKGAGKLIINGIMYWYGGVMEGGGTTIINTGAVLNINDNYSRSIKNRIIDIYGTANINSFGSLMVNATSSAKINIYSSAVFDAKSDFSFTFNNYSDSMTINNYGLLKKSAGTGYLTFGRNCLLNNFNTVNVQSGILKLNGGGTSGSTFQIASGCQILLESGNHYWTGNTSLSGSGLFKLYDGNGYNNINLFIQDTSIGSIIKNGVTLELGYNSYLKGNGKLVVQGTLLCSYGRLYGNGIIQVDSNAVLSLTISTYVENRTINNYGTINLQASFIPINNAKTIINNHYNGVIDVKNDQGGSGYYQSYSDSASLNNFGLVKKTGGTGVSKFSETTKFYNSGTVEVNTGTLWIYDLRNYSNKKISGGIFKVNSSNLRFGHSTIASASFDTIASSIFLNGSSSQILNYNGSNAISNILAINSEGKLTFQDGKHFTFNPSASSLTNNGEINLMNANITIASSKTFNNYGTFNCGKDTLKGDGIFIHHPNANLGIGHQQGISSSSNNGNIQNLSTRTFSSSANYTYNGDSLQVTGSGLPSTVNNLTVNNTQNVNLTNDILINGNLNFSNGKLFTDTNHTVTLGSSGIINGEKTGSYLVGKLVTTKSVGTDSSNLGNIGLFLNSGTDNLGNVTVTRISGNNGIVSYNGKTSISRKWIISSDNPPANGRQLTLAWISDDDNGKNLNSMQIWKSQDGNTWSNAGSIQNGSNHFVNINTNSFSYWTVSDSAIGNVLLTANIKVYLHGCFNSGTGLMNTLLTAVLPLNQPYNVSPWNYNGIESVTSIPPNVVDWVLIELRSDLTTVVGRRAGFLKNNGSIVDTDGVSKLSFNSLGSGNYYVVIRHRNHLAVMTAAAVSLNENSTEYDFTDNINKSYGTNSMKELTTGIFGLYSGDGNASGGISATDRNNVWRVQNGTNGYLSGDYNLSGGVSAADRNSFWRVNNGINSQVP